MHVNNSTFKSVYEMRSNVWKINRFLRVTRSHPYIEEVSTYYFREMQCIIKGPLEATCMAYDAQGRASVRWGAPAR